MPKRPRMSPGSRPDLMGRIARIQRNVDLEIAYDFRLDRHALAFGLLAQEMLIEAKRHSSTEYALRWLAVIEARLRCDSKAADRAMAHLRKVEPKVCLPDIEPKFP